MAANIQIKKQITKKNMYTFGLAYQINGSRCGKTSPLEDTHARIFSNKFGKSLAYSYL